MVNEEQGAKGVLLVAIVLWIDESECLRMNTIFLGVVVLCFDGKVLFVFLLTRQCYRVHDPCTGWCCGVLSCFTFVHMTRI